MLETLGKFLLASRLKKGLTVEEVSEATRIGRKFIRAIEEDQFDLLPSDVIAKGFLRTYAKELGLDGDDILSRYGSLNVEMKDKSPELISMPLRIKSNYSNRRILILLVLSVAALAALYSYNPDNNNVVQTRQVVSPKAEKVAPVENLSVEPKQSEPQIATTETEIVEQAEPVVTESEEGATTESDQLQDTSRPLNLTLSAISNSWVKVVVDGEITREIILRGGKEVTWWAEKEYSLSIGNIAGTKVLLNGEEIPIEPSRSNIIMNLKLPPEDGEANASERQ